MIRLRGVGYINAAGVEVPGPAPDPNTPIPASGSMLDQMQAEIEALFGYTQAGQVTNCGCGVTVPMGATCPTLRADCGGVQSSQWISGVPNWVTGVCGAVAALVIVKALR